MAQHTIVEKLKGLLQKPLTTEVQVVYLLVELRKLLEHEKKKDAFSVLTFYCNWTVHTEISQSSIADRLVQYFDDFHKGMEAGGTQFPVNEELWGMLSYSLLQQELIACLHHFGLPSGICTDETLWKTFVGQLIRVIEDTPLTVNIRKTAPDPNGVRSFPTRFVKSVSISVLHPSNQPRQLSWNSHFHTRPTHKHANFTLSFRLAPEGAPIPA